MGDPKKSRFSGISSQFEVSPKEEPAMIGTRRNKLFIGIPKDGSNLDKRVPLTPSAVSVLVNNGHRVLIESKAGEASRFKDTDFSEAGAEITLDRKQVYEAEIILKVSPPPMEEVKMMRPNQVLISPLQLSTVKTEYIQELIKRKVTAIAFEYVKDDSGAFPFVRSMSEIAGSTSILIASEYLSHEHHGKGILLGGISGVAPSKVVILGAGVVGEYAARTALGLGATVKIFDNNIYKLMRLQNNIGLRLFTSIFDPDVLEMELVTADVAIGAIHAEAGRTPVIVTEDMVSKMRPGSVIVDVSIDQGGCFETSEVTTFKKPTYTKFDVIHYCIPNIPSRVSRTASYAISNILSPLLLKCSQYGSMDKLLHQSLPERNGTYVYKGCLTNEHIGERFGLKYMDLNLLFTAEM